MEGADVPLVHGSLRYGLANKQDDEHVFIYL